MKYYKILIIGFLLMSVTTYSQYYTGIDRRIGATPANQQGPPQPTQ